MAERVDVVNEETGEVLNTFLFGPGRSVDTFVAEYVPFMPAGQYLRIRDAKPVAARARLSWDQVHRMRRERLHDMAPIEVLATRYGVGVATVHAILSGHTWKVREVLPTPKLEGVES